MKKRLYLLHRWIGLLVCVPVLLWTLSGIAHPIMTLRDLQPVRFKPPHQHVDPADLKVDPADALLQNQIERIEQLRVVVFEGQTYYQVRSPNREGIQYLNAATGELLPNGDEIYAEFLARHYTGETTAGVAGMSRLTAFDREYAEVFRFLPVYRVEFDRADGLRAYVDTSSSRLGNLNDRLNGAMLWAFQCFHTWDFLSFHEPLQHILLIGLSALVFIGAVSGLALYSVLYRRLTVGKGRRARVRRWHRLVGLMLSGVMLLASFSGAYHAWNKMFRTPLPALLPAETAAADLKYPLAKVLKSLAEMPVESLSLVQSTAGPCYRITFETQPASVVYIRLADGSKWEDGDYAYAQQLANRASGRSDSEVVERETVTHFGPDYGFIQRRLPVVKVQYRGEANVRYFVETSTGVVAGRAYDSDRAERWTFSNLHKWAFADGLGNRLRDVLLACVTLGSAVVAALGLILLTGVWRQSAV